MLINKTDSL